MVILRLAIVAGVIAAWVLPSSAKAEEPKSTQCYKGNAAACAELQRTCDLNNAEACDDLAYGLQRDPAKEHELRARAAQIIDAACSRGVASACYAMSGRYLSNELGVTHDYAKSHAYRDKACAIGSGAACYFIALDYQWQGHPRPDYDKALQFYNKACTLGDGDACQNARQPIIMLSLKCNHGDAASCYAAGVERLRVRSTTFDDEADDDFDRACHGGYVQACLNFGEQLSNDGKKVEALAQLNRACDANIGEACKDVGYLFYFTTNPGEPIQQDIGKARAYFTKACRLGVKDGCDMAKQ